MVTDFWQVPPIGTPTIQIDINPESLGRNYPPSAGVLGDAKATLRACSTARTRHRSPPAGTVAREVDGISVHGGPRSSRSCRPTTSRPDPNGCAAN